MSRISGWLEWAIVGVYLTAVSATVSMLGAAFIDDGLTSAHYKISGCVLAAGGVLSLVLYRLPRPGRRDHP